LYPTAFVPATLPLDHPGLERLRRPRPVPVGSGLAGGVLVVRVADLVVADCADGTELLAPGASVRERKAQPRALTQAERDTVRAVLNSPTFVDKAPASVYHELLDEGVHLCSPSTMYRILRAHNEVKERRRQATHPARVKPELVAIQPNQCWSWAITKLHGPTKWTYYYLYVIIDIC
jgi:hypothetical protein